MKTTFITCLCVLGLWFSRAQEKQAKDSLNVSLISLEEVSVAGLRANEKQPVPFSEVTKEDLKNRNLGQDLPFLLNFLPSVVTTSDAGAGIGYTGIRVRGSDATRVNVTINGIPYNDAESQGTFWVNMPDFASSVESIQLQRGAGTSTNGSSAFGASLNILTDAGAPTAYAEITNAVGSFGTLRNTLKFSTGLLNDRVEFSGRLAKISSEGYIDRASSELKSYFLQGLYKDNNTLIKTLAFGGHEVTYQSWVGVDPFTLENNRTYNFAGGIYEDGDLTGYYDNQVDNYRQDHYQLHWNQAFSNNWSSSLGLNYTYGRGYYEEYNNDDSLANLRIDDVVLGGVTQSTTDGITRKWLDNDFYVLTANAQYNVAETNLVLGGMYSTYDGDHFGNLIWARFASNPQPNHEFYRNKGEKKEVSFFGKLTQKINDQWSGYVDLQFRKINYTAAGTVNGLGTIDIDDSFNFFNPKFGFTYAASENAQWYISYAKAQREPNRIDYENGNPRPEVLNNFEAGLRKKSVRAQWSANLYYMRYKDQLVLTGGIDDVGAPIRENVGDSYRLGIELDAKIALNDQWLWQPNLTLSQNKNKEFNFQRDGQLINLGDTNISYSPNIVAGSNLVFVPSTQFQIGLLSKYVGEQYMGNIDADLSKLSAYFINDLNLSYAVGPTTWAKGIDLSLLVNNIFNVQFESNGYFYTNDDTWSSPSQVTTIEGVGYYPQAGINFLLGATIKL
jgi:iron complex outermembrane recepter protein